MKAVVCENGRLEVAETENATPGPRQVVLDVSGCGICGSDLHVIGHADDQADALAEVGYTGFMRSNQRVVLGHEFVGRVAGYGPDCDRSVRSGTPVVALPLVRNGSEMHAIGLSASAPGAYAEQVVVEESLMLAVPSGLSSELAVLTEPMAIAHHAVRRGEVRAQDVAIVIGCGPVGLAVVCMLKARGVRTVVASDPSPGRRAIAGACGADVVVDPYAESPYDVPAGGGFVRTVPQAAMGAVAAVEALQRSRLRLPWHVVWRASEKLGTKPQRPVIFECVGLPGVIDGIIATAPLFSRIVVVGVCMETDSIRPVLAINKQVDLRFVVGYTPLEFRDTLQLLARGKVDPSPIVTDTVGLTGTATAFEALRDPESHAKIVIDPRSPAAAPMRVH